MIKKNLANIITSSRILGTVVLLFLPVLSRAFFGVYVYCGVSDVLDGFVARRTDTTSQLGSRLDSVSDLCFYVVMMVKLLPLLCEVLPQAIWIMILLVLALRVFLYLWVAFHKRYLLANHTVLNKITGLLVFGTPFFVRARFFGIYAAVVCTEAMAAVFYEAALLKGSKRKAASEDSDAK